ncbi:MAG: 50S ribosomal protein L4 [Gemmatimonadaceae bacterium]
MAETNNTSVDAAAFTAQGTPRDRVALPAETFDGTVNLPVMHQAVKAFLANQRQGNASTKTRGEVVGGNQKPWKQKGTGRARQGSIRSPNWVGGGTVFGPRPRKYTEVVPKQVRALARKSAFNARAREGALIVIDAFSYDAPKTSRLQQLLARLEVAHRKVLILTDGVKQNVFLSGRNIPLAHVMPFSDVSTYHILWSDVVLVESGALGEALAPVKEKELAAVKVVRYVARGTEDRGPKTEDGEPEAGGRKPKKKAVKAKAAARKAPPKKKAAAKKPAAKAAARKAPAKKAAPKKKGK